MGIEKFLDDAFKDEYQVKNKEKIRIVKDIQTNGRLVLFDYTGFMMYLKESEWDHVTESSRGLVLDIETKRVIALPFQKFFKIPKGRISELKSEEIALITEKADGDLGIAFFDPIQKKWRANTR